LVETGHVVDYIENNQFIVAICLDSKKGRPRLLTQANREVVISARRLTHDQGQSMSLNLARDELVNRLKDVSARREEIKAGIDLAELWSLLVEDDPAEPLDPAFLAGLLFGEPVTPDQVAALIRAAVENKVYFRYRPEGLEVTSAEKVEELLAQKVREEELAREREEVGGWLRSVWTGRPAETPAETEAIIARLIDAAILGPDSNSFGKVKGWLETAGIKHPRAAFELLVRLGRFSPDEDLELRRLKVPTEFPGPVLDEAQRVARADLPRAALAGREDLTGLETFTLDGAESRDFDDALSYRALARGHEVFVHITDVAVFVEPESLLDLEARARASSLYLPDQRLPMLPQILSEDRLSLRENELRPALSLRVELDEQAQVLGYELVKSLIRVDRRLIYSQADLNLDRDPRLSALHDLALKLKANRLQNGALLLDVPEVWVRPMDGRVELFRNDQTTPARLLVAEMMILANRLAAESLAEAGVPTLFRCQLPPGHFEAPPGSDPLWATLRQRMTLNPMELSPLPAPHAGLGLECYTTFTSPIRRYLDLITVRQLHGLLDHATPPYNQEALEDMTQSLGPLLRSHNQLRFRRLRYWLLKYLAQEGERTWEALVLDRLQDRYSLVLLEIMLRLPSPKLPEGALHPGHRVQVRVAKIDPADDYIRLDLA